MLEKILKPLANPKWQQEDPEKRLEALRELDDSLENHQPIFSQLAIEDTDTRVRLLAISKVDDLDKLAHLARHAGNAEEQSAATIRLAQMLARHYTNTSTLIQASKAYNDLPLLSALACHSESNDQQLAVIAIIDDEQVLSHIACHATIAKTRQLAAEKITSTDVLTQLEKETLGKDKAVNHIARDKLKDIKQHETEQQALEQQLLELCEKLEALAAGSYDPLFHQQLQHLQQQWQTLGGTDCDFNERFIKAQNLCLQHLEQHESQSREADEHEAGRAEICDTLDTLIQTIPDTADKPIHELLDFLTKQLEPLQQHWKALSNESQPSPKTSMRYQNSSRTLNTLHHHLHNICANENLAQTLEQIEACKTADPQQLKQWRKQLDKATYKHPWPDEIPCPPLVSRVSQGFEKLQLLGEQAKTSAAEAEKELNTLLTEIEKQLSDGAIDSAAKNINRGYNLRQKLNNKAANQLEGKLQLLSKQLYEYRDWQNYAALPKQTELCEKMEQLIGIDLPPNELAKAIKDLQKQWQDLHGGRSKEEQMLWKRFRKASDKAYKPCKAFFNDQQKIKQQNLEQRYAICTELEQYHQKYDWENADWKAVNKIIETAKNEFHKFSPVDNKDFKAVKARFSETLKPLNDKLIGEQKKNEQLKQQLIEQAERLNQQQDLDEQIEQLKKLQQQWQQIGITRRREDQKLWKKFRALCSPAFEKKQQNRQEFRDNIKNDITAANEICQQINKLAKADDNTLRQSSEAFNALKDRFHALEHLSKQHQKREFKRFYDACDFYKKRYGGIDRRKQQHHLKEAHRKAQLCDEIEACNNIDQLPALADGWESETALPEPLNTILEKRFSQAQTLAKGDSTTDRESNEQQRRLILIQLEILLDRETPAEDKPLRMEYQLKQLSSDFGKGKNQGKSQLNELIQEWFGCGPATEQQQAKLQQRFEQLAEKQLK